MIRPETQLRWKRLVLVGVLGILAGTCTSDNVSGGEASRRGAVSTAPVPSRATEQADNSDAQHELETEPDHTAQDLAWRPGDASAYASLVSATSTANGVPVSDWAEWLDCRNPAPNASWRFVACTIPVDGQMATALLIDWWDEYSVDRSPGSHEWAEMGIHGAQESLHHMVKLACSEGVRRVYVVGLAQGYDVVLLSRFESDQLRSAAANQIAQHLSRVLSTLGEDHRLSAEAHECSPPY
jgi:hypothetical protein